LVTVDYSVAHPLVSRLRGGGLDVRPVFEWGNRAGYAALQRDRPPTILLDIPRGADGIDLGRHVSALATLGDVVVVAGEPVDIAEAMGAGARDVVPRAAPPVRIASRIQAHLCRADPPLTSHTPDVRSPRSTSDFLIDWLLAHPGEFCCHDLRWLLGRPGAPLSLTRIRAQLRRVEPKLRAHGRHLRQTHGWGAALYLVEPIA
jgi:DNA-binding response OmpR family regulator